MRFASTLSAATTLAMASASELALYWGQASGGNQQSLGDYCKNSAGDIYLISFLDSFGSGRQLSMEVNGYWNNIPGTQLPDAASTIGQDIKTCQSLGKKVLVSMGGASGNYGFNSDSDAQNVAQQLWNIFGGGQSSTRPFGDAKIDGFDLDGENNIDAPEYIAFVNELRQLYSQDSSKTYYVSAAPQCPFPDATVGQAIAHSQFDYLFVQFYNNYCTPLGNNFNWDTWQSFASSQSPNRNVKLFLGLPGSPSAAGSGYATPEQVKQTVAKIRSTPNFGGIMLWDAAQANNNHVDGTTFAQEMENILDDGAAPAPATSSVSSSAIPAPAPAPQTLSSSASPAAPASAQNPESASSSSPRASAWTPASSSSSSEAPAWTPASSSSSSEAPAWTPASSSEAAPQGVQASSSSSAAPAWAPASSSSVANAGAVESPSAPQESVFTTQNLQGGNVVVTKGETFTTTSSCSTTSATPNGATPSAPASAVDSTTTTPATPASSPQAASVSTSSEIVSYATATATRVTKAINSGGQDVWVTVHETFYTTECPSSVVANGAPGSPTSTVHSTSTVVNTRPGVTTTTTSWPARETSVEEHDFTSNGEVYVYDTVWNTAYTTVWVR